MKNKINKFSLIGIAVASLAGLAFFTTPAQAQNNPTNAETASTTNPGFWQSLANAGEAAWQDVGVPLETNSIVGLRAGYGLNTATHHQIEALQITAPISQYVSIGFVGAHYGSEWLYGGATVTLGITENLPVLGTVQEFAGDGVVYDFENLTPANYSYTGVEKYWTVNSDLTLGIGAIVANVSSQSGVDILGGGNLTWHF